MRRITSLLVVLAIVSLGLATTGCREEGTMEKAGKAADEAAEEVAEEAEKAKKKAAEALE